MKLTSFIYGLPALISGLLIVDSVMAASFDCNKASNYVEKRICADAIPFTHGLSELDDNLSRAYQTMLQRADNPEVIKKEQREWLKSRNRCKDAACIEQAYEERFRTLSAHKFRPKTILPSSGKTVESNVFPNEKEKLKVIKEIIKTHDMRPSSSFYSLKEKPFCKILLQDLIANKVKAVEPNVYAETAFDPALKKWQACSEKEMENSNSNDIKRVFEGITLLGLPPYRYYQIDIDGNQNNGKEDLLYYETGAPYYNKNIQVGNTGYSWVDLKSCLVMGGAPMSNIYIHRNDPGNYYRFSLIAEYKKKYYAVSVYPNTKNQNISNYNLSLIEITQSSSPANVCAWREPITASKSITKE